MKRVVEDHTLHMEIIVNNKVTCLQIKKSLDLTESLFKTLDKGINIIQLETASGAAIKSFEGAQGQLRFSSLFFY